MAEVSDELIKLAEDFGKKSAQIEKEFKETKEVSADNAKQLNDMLGKIDDLGKGVKEQVEALAVRINKYESLGTPAEQDAKATFEGQIYEHAKSLVESGFGSKMKDSASFAVKNGNKLLYTKVVGDMTNANLTGGYATRLSIPEIVHAPYRKMHIRSLLRVIPSSSAIIEYPKVTGGEGGVAMQTEGSGKAQIDYDLTMQTATPKTIAVFSRQSKQMMSDIPQLADFLANDMTQKWLNFEDTQILSGDNTGQNFNGILTQATDYVKTNASITTYYDYIIDAIGQLENANYETTGIVLNPIDFVALLTYKASTGGEYTHPGLVYGADNILRLYGTPIVKTGAINRLNGLIGDFSYAKLYVNDGLSFDVSYEDGTNFTTNKVTFRVEGREVLVVTDGAAFRDINFAQIAS